MTVQQLNSSHDELSHEFRQKEPLPEFADNVAEFDRSCEAFATVYELTCDSDDELVQFTDRDMTRCR